MHCDFTTGATEVMHDTEKLTDVEHCHDPGLTIVFDRQDFYTSSTRLLPEEHHLHQRTDPGGRQHVPDRLLDRVSCLL